MTEEELQRKIGFRIQVRSEVAGTGSVIHLEFEDDGKILERGVRPATIAEVKLWLCLLEALGAHAAWVDAYAAKDNLGTPKGK